MLKRIGYLVGGLVLIGLPIFFRMTPVKAWTEYRESASWPKVQATVTKLEECFGPARNQCRLFGDPLAPRHRGDPAVRVYYSYQYNGRAYETYLEDDGSWYWLQLREPPGKGQKVELLVNPQRPDAVARSPAEVLLTNLFLLVAPFAGAFFIYLAVSGRADPEEDE